MFSVFISRSPVLLSALFPARALSAGAADRLNLLWFVVDDMSANFSCYGEKVIETPHVDRLAAEGTKFTRAFVTATAVVRPPTGFARFAPRHILTSALSPATTSPDAQ